MNTIKDLETQENFPGFQFVPDSETENINEMAIEGTVPEEPSKTEPLGNNPRKERRRKRRPHGRAGRRTMPAARPDVQAGHFAEKFRLTQLGNAERLVARDGHNLRYCHAWKKWLIWNGTRWEVDDSGEVERRAAKTVRSIYREASNAADSELRTAITGHAKRSESKGELDAMIALARSLDGIPVSPEELDKDSLLFNCSNGTIDLRTGVLRKHGREDLITKMGGARYDPDAQCPVWIATLNRLMGGNTAVLTYVQKIIGYAFPCTAVILKATGLGGCKAPATC